MNRWNENDSFTPIDDNPVDSILDNFCSMSEADDSGHFTASPEADGHGESLVGLVEISSSPSKTTKEFPCNRNSISSKNFDFDDDGCLSIMSAPGVLRGITKHLEKSANSPHNSDSDDGRQLSKNPISNYPNTYLGDVLKDFNSLFKEKLKYIDDASRHADTRTKILMMERRNEVLEQWAKDVCSQNMLLVHTVEELEEEANRKVKTLQAKINATTNLARSHMEMIQQYEKQVEELLSEQSAAQKKYEMLTYEHMEVNKSYKTIQQRLKVLESDNDSLRSLVCRIRDMGVWDVNGLQLQPSTYDLLFGLYPNLAGSEVQTVFTREKARNIFDTEIKSKEMEKYIVELKDAKKEVDLSLEEKEKTVITLEAEVKSLTTVLTHYQGQCDDLKKVLEETQDKLIQVTNKSNLSSVETKEELTSAMSRRDQDIKDMLNELRDLKTQLHKACDERQSAIYETKMLKRELGDRTSEMLELRNILQIIQTEAECTRSAVQNVQDKQDHLSVLKEQVHSYQDKYEQAQTLLSSKSEMIQSLQQQMSMLHEKVTHLESQSYSPITSFEKKECDKADSVLTGNSSSRNMIPSLIDNSVSAALKRFEATAKERVAKMFEESKRKPAWSTHFTKGSVQSSAPSSSLQKNKNVSNAEQKPVAVVSKSTQQKESDRPPKPLKHKVSSTCTKISPMNKAADIVEKSKTERQSISKKPQHVVENNNLKLPKISLADWMQSSSQDKKNSNDRPRSSGGLGNERLPKLVEKQVKVDNPVFTKPKMSLENPMVQRSSLHNLMEVAIGGSNPFLQDIPYASKSGIAPSRERRTRSSPKISKENEKDLPRSGNAKRAKDRRVSFQLKNKSARSKSSSAPSDAAKYSRTKLNVTNADVNSLLPCPTWDAEEILQHLPQQPNEISVKNWIASSSKTCLELSKRMKEARSKYSISGRSTPSSSSRKSLRKRRFSASAKKSHEPQLPPIYSLEDEWDKTMAKVTKRSSGMEDTYLEEPTVIQNNISMDDSSKIEGMTNGHGKDFERDTSELHEPPLVNGNNNIILLEDQTVIKKSVVHKLKEEFSMEKAQIEKEYLEELRNKDIEITMQKLALRLGELKRENSEILLHAEVLDERVAEYILASSRHNEEKQLEMGCSIMEIIASCSTHPVTSAPQEVQFTPEIDPSVMQTILELQSKLAAERKYFQKHEQELLAEHHAKISEANALISELAEQILVIKNLRAKMAAFFHEEQKQHSSSVNKVVQTDEFFVQQEKSLETTLACRNDNDIVEAAEEKLLERKRAYDSNENILQNQLSQYSEYVEKLRCKIISNGLKTHSEISKDELVSHLSQSVHYFKQKNKTLLVEKEALKAEMKLLAKREHRSVKASVKLRNENCLMRNTISSLSQNIQQLTDDNEKLLLKIHHQHRNNPCTSSKEKAELLEKGCGDSCKCEHSEHSASSDFSSYASFLSNPLNMSNENTTFLASGEKLVAANESAKVNLSNGSLPRSIRSKIPRPCKH